MTVGVHHNCIDAMGIRPASQCLADRATASIGGFERGTDPVFPAGLVLRRISTQTKAARIDPCCRPTRGGKASLMGIGFSLSLQ